MLITISGLVNTHNLLIFNKYEKSFKKSSKKFGVMLKSILYLIYQNNQKTQNEKAKRPTRLAIRHHLLRNSLPNSNS